jgi:hypothetical protein
MTKIKWMDGFDDRRRSTMGATPPPWLDNIISDITDRFSDQLTNFLDINVLIPNYLINIGDAELKKKINQTPTNFAKVMYECRFC